MPARVRPARPTPPRPTPQAFMLTCDRELPGLAKYRAYRRTLQNGTTEYLSVLLLEGMTAQEYTGAATTEV
jgi:hypothetical protein